MESDGGAAESGHGLFYFDLVLFVAVGKQAGLILKAAASARVRVTRQLVGIPVPLSHPRQSGVIHLDRPNEFCYNIFVIWKSRLRRMGYAHLHQHRPHVYPP
jgi:hypothetical protein